MSISDLKAAWRSPRFVPTKDDLWEMAGLLNDPDARFHAVPAYENWTSRRREETRFPCSFDLKIPVLALPKFAKKRVGMFRFGIGETIRQENLSWTERVAKDLQEKWPGLFHEGKLVGLAHPFWLVYLKTSVVSDLEEYAEVYDDDGWIETPWGRALEPGFRRGLRSCWAEALLLCDVLLWLSVKVEKGRKALLKRLQSRAFWAAQPIAWWRGPAVREKYQPRGQLASPRELLGYDETWSSQHESEEIDLSIQGAIEALNRCGKKTISSCQGGYKAISKEFFLAYGGYCLPELEPQGFVIGDEVWKRGQAHVFFTVGEGHGRGGAVSKEEDLRSLLPKATLDKAKRLARVFQDLQGVEVRVVADETDTCVDLRSSSYLTDVGAREWWGRVIARACP